MSKIIRKGTRYAKKTLATATNIANGVQNVGNDVMEFHDNHKEFFDNVATAAKVGMAVAPYVAPLLL
jgi:7-cyano-7-deazaguanine synthase in queuosine biosynthesis